jgi:hypothetical protein
VKSFKVKHHVSCITTRFSEDSIGNYLMKTDFTLFYHAEKTQHLRSREWGHRCSREQHLTSSDIEEWHNKVTGSQLKSHRQTIPKILNLLNLHS